MGGKPYGIIFVIISKNSRSYGDEYFFTPHIESLVKTKVESGLYRLASEVMREALRLLDGRD